MTLKNDSDPPVEPSNVSKNPFDSPASDIESKSQLKEGSKESNSSIVLTKELSFLEKIKMSLPTGNEANGVENGAKTTNVPLKRQPSASTNPFDEPSETKSSSSSLSTLTIVSSNSAKPKKLNKSPLLSDNKPQSISKESQTGEAKSKSRKPDPLNFGEVASQDKIFSSTATPGIDKYLDTADLSAGII